MSKNDLREDTKVFNVYTIEDYLTLCANALAQLKNEPANVLAGYSAIMLINHIPDWASEKLPNTHREGIGLSGNQQQIRENAKTEYPKIDTIRQLANGFKHLKPVSNSQIVEGFGAGPFGVGPFGVPYLLVEIDCNDAAEDRYIDCYSLCDEVLNWWQEKLAKTKDS